ncbi:uncharacterized protein PG986_010345 [Apiospora aurea]|uniref:Uncharacterized protein n=1 Tax=Apiospora aurea TaxID=335848 RepID=A0ABR1Q211_9PEZI
MRFVTVSAGLASWAAVANAGACYPCRKLQCAVGLRAAGILDKPSVAYSECAAAMAAHSAPASAVTNTVTATATATETATTSTTPVVHKVSAIPVQRRRSVATAVAVPVSLQQSCTSVDEYLAGCACFNVQPTGAAAVTTTVTSTVSRGPTAATTTVTSSAASFLHAGPTSTATVKLSETSTLSLGPTATVPSETVTATSTVVEQAQTQTLHSFLLQPTDEPDAYIGFMESYTGRDGLNVIVRDRAQAMPCTYYGAQDGAASLNNYVMCVFSGYEYYFTQTLDSDAVYGATAVRITQVGGAVKPACHFDDQGVLSCSDTGTDQDTNETVQRTLMRYSTNPQGYFELELVAPGSDMKGYKEVVLRAVPV